MRAAHAGGFTFEPPARRDPVASGQQHGRYAAGADQRDQILCDAPDPIWLTPGERIRLTIVNDTMMAHPMHLHGVFVELENGHGPECPYVHTINGQPAERVSLLATPVGSRAVGLPLPRDVPHGYGDVPDLPCLGARWIDGDERRGGRVSAASKSSRAVWTPARWRSRCCASSAGVPKMRRLSCRRTGWTKTASFARSSSQNSSRCTRSSAERPFDFEVVSWIWRTTVVSSFGLGERSRWNSAAANCRAMCCSVGSLARSGRRSLVLRSTRARGRLWGAPHSMCPPEQSGRDVV